jgi:restriction endonuclease Mrr
MSTANRWTAGALVGLVISVALAALAHSAAPPILFVVFAVVALKVVSDREERQERIKKAKARLKAARDAEIQREQERQRQKQERERQIEALLHRDALRDRIDYMSGIEFERFMADVFTKKGYTAHTTRASGDQGVDLLLNVDGRKIAVQLKRYTAPVGNAAVQAAFAGMIYYKAQEAWVITTSSFTKSAIALAKNTGVRLIARNELENWLSDLRDEA